MIESLSAIKTSFSLVKCSNERKCGSSGSSMIILEVSGRKGRVGYELGCMFS